MADHPGAHNSDNTLQGNIEGLFPGGAGLLLKSSGVGRQLADSIASQQRKATPPVPTRGIGGPPAVNKGIQNTPAPITQLQSNPSGVAGTPQIPLTPTSPSVAPTSPNIASPSPQIPPAAGQVGLRNRAIPGAGSTGSPLADELKNRLKRNSKQF